MLDELYLASVADSVTDIWDKLNNWTIIDIVNRIMSADLYHYNSLPGTARYRAWMLNQSGMHYDEMIKQISQLTHKSETEVKRLFKESGLLSLNNEANIYGNHGISVQSLMENQVLQSVLESTYNRTNGEIHNLTRTTADASNKLLIDKLDKAYFEVAKGNRTYSDVINEIVGEVGSTGAMVQYESGHQDSIETSVRRAVMTGINQGAGRLSLANAKELGCKYVIVSAHIGARVSEDHIASHAGWQGGIYKIEGADERYSNLEASTGFPSNPTGLCGYNCRHSFFPYFLGDDNPFKAIAGDKQANEYAYKLSQKQRAMERGIRKTKKQLLAYDTAIDQCKDEKTKFDLSINRDKIADKLKKQNKKYSAFCNENGLTKEADRLRISYKNKKNRSNGRTEKLYKDVTQEWLFNTTPNSSEVKDMLEYTYDGTVYKVDGRHVLLDYNNKEKEVAQLIADTFGGEIFMVPRVLNPSNISTPDYMFRGEPLDLKVINGSSKNVLYNAVNKKKRQANNFIFDISNCLLDINEISRQISDLYSSKHTSFIEKIFIIKDEKIINVFIRQKAI